MYEAEFIVHTCSCNLGNCKSFQDNATPLQKILAKSSPFNEKLMCMSILGYENLKLGLDILTGMLLFRGILIHRMCDQYDPNTKQINEYIFARFKSLGDLRLI